MDMMHDEDDFPTVAVDVEAIGHLTLRLAQVLAEEVDVLDAMRLDDLEKLQEEKNMLTNALDRQKRLLERHPEMLESMDDEQREYLRQVAAVFDDVLQENHRKLLSAREVNRTMVEAIKETIQDHASRGVYSVRGVADTAAQALPVTLNNVV